MFHTSHVLLGNNCRYTLLDEEYQASQHTPLRLLCHVGSQGLVITLIWLDPPQRTEGALVFHGVVVVLSRKDHVSGDEPAALTVHAQARVSSVQLSCLLGILHPNMHEQYTFELNILCMITHDHEYDH